MRSWTRPANASFSASVSGRDDVSRKRLETSRRLTFERLVDPQMETALVEKAVEKLERGPT